MSSRQPLSSLSGLVVPAGAPTLVPAPGEVRVASVEARDGLVTVAASSLRASAACPVCGRRSRRVQSWDKKVGALCGVRSRIGGWLRHLTPEDGMGATAALPTTAIAGGLDVGDRCTHVCVLDEAGAVVEEARLATTAAALTRRFGGTARVRAVLEAGTHSP